LFLLRLLLSLSLPLHSISSAASQLVLTLVFPSH
jgi:hypothetical protein